MGFSQDNIAFLALVISSGLIALSNAAHLHINNNYMLDYELTNNSQTIEFKIQAINVTGWVGIGINENLGNMNGSDLFIGGYNATSRGGYGMDFYVPPNPTGNIRPTPDNKQDWNLVSAKEENGTTFIHVRRLLNTTDEPYDQVIQDKNMFLLWAFHQTNDDWTGTKHTHRGSVTVNLIASSSGTVSIGVSAMILGLLATVLKR